MEVSKLDKFLAIFSFKVILMTNKISLTIHSVKTDRDKKELVRVFKNISCPTVKICSPLGAQAGAFYDFLLVKILE